MTALTIVREVLEDDFSHLSYNKFMHTRLCDRNLRTCPQTKKHEKAVAEAAYLLAVVLPVAEDATDDAHEAAYDDFAAAEYTASLIALAVEAWGPTPNTPARFCPNQNADYCMAHDYDHVLARREQDDFNERWAEMKNEFAAREREQEAAAYAAMRD